MKKCTLILLALIVAAPAFANTITITAVETTPGANDGSIDLNYSVSDANLPRAFALKLTLSTGFFQSVDPNMVGVNDVSGKGYGIFMGNYALLTDPCNPNFNEAGYSPIAPNSAPDNPGELFDSNNIIVEMGSLYDGDGNKPPTSGKLCTIEIGPTACLTVTEDSTRGGIVMEDTGITPVVDLTGATNICFTNNGCQSCLGNLIDPGGVNNLVNTTDLSILVGRLRWAAAQACNNYEYKLIKDDPCTGALYMDCANVTEADGKPNQMNTLDISILVGWLRFSARPTGPHPGEYWYYCGTLGVAGQ